MTSNKRTTHELIERIRVALKELRLTAMATQLDELLSQSGVEDGSRLEFLWRLLEPEEIGVTLTDGMMMEPEASVSAMVFHHPDARYFSVKGTR